MIRIATLAALALTSIAIASPAMAMKGIDAARACESRPDCHVTYRDDGSIFIDAAGGKVECEGPQRECIVLSSRKVIKGGPAAVINGPSDRI